MNRIAQTVTELAGDAALFVIAFLLSTGLTCGGEPIKQVACGGSKVEVAAP